MMTQPATVHLSHLITPLTGRVLEGTWGSPAADVLPARCGVERGPRDGDIRGYTLVTPVVFAGVIVHVTLRFSLDALAQVRVALTDRAVTQGIRTRQDLLAGLEDLMDDPPRPIDQGLWRAGCGQTRASLDMLTMTLLLEPTPQ